MKFLSSMDARGLYDFVRKWFTLVAVYGGPITLVINAPFGRFSLQQSIFHIDGIKAWIFFELVSPACFTYALMSEPLGTTLSMPLGTKLLVAAYYIHYLNRALISPLRTPSRSKSHLAVVLAAVAFNICNGSNLGAYLSSPYAKVFAATVSPLRLYGGLALWAFGFIGNIVHDEILLNIRRKANSKGKGKASEDPSGKNKKEHYDIPHGLLYSFISYPNYFCEWVEWLGFALAAAPIPPLDNLAQLLNPLNAAKIDPSLFAPFLTPPWIFFITEITTMLPRAWKGHRWYHQTFPHYPKERKIVVPFVL